MLFIRRFLAVLFMFNACTFALGAFVMPFTEDGAGSRLFGFLFFAAVAYGSYVAGRKLWGSKLIQPIKPATSPASSAPKSVNHSMLRHLSSLAELVLADDKVDQNEAEILLNWFLDNPETKTEPLTSSLYLVLNQSLSDGVLDADEAEEIKTALSEFCDRQERGATKSKPSVKRKVPKPEKPVKAVAKKTRSKAAVSAGDGLLINYIDSKGDASERRVKVRSITKKNDRIYLNAVCLEKNKYRSFRADRIEDMTMLSTGEYIQDLQEYLVA